MPKFAGVDPSLTSSGVVTYDNTTGAKLVVSFSSPTTGDSVLEKHSRIHKLATKIYEAVVTDGKPVCVGIEGPAYSSNTGKAWDRAGLWWYIVRMFIDNDIKVVEVPPTSRAKFSTGRGNSGKDEVLLAVSRTYPDFDIKNNDHADALVIMSVVSRLHGFNVEQGTIPQNKMDAITKLKKDLKWDL